MNCDTAFFIDSAIKDRATENSGPAVPPRPIHTIRSLFEALRSGDVATRLSALKAVQAQPQTALSFGIFQGLDVIDVMLTEANRVEGTLEWMDWVGTLGRFIDPRVTEYFLGLLAAHDEPRVLFAAARYLQQVPKELPVKTLHSLLLENANPVRARAVCLLIPLASAWSERARLRIALLSASEVRTAPACDKDTANIWLAELAGPFRPEALNSLRGQGEQAWAALATLWDGLETEDQVWLLQWGWQEFGSLVAGVLPQALMSKSRLVILEALRTLGELGENGAHESIRSLAATFLRDPDSALRQAAAQAGPCGVDWRAFLATETDVSVRRACVVQLTKTQGERSIRDLIGFLSIDDWQLRALAADCLVMLGKPAAEAVKPLVHDPDQNTRIAAARVLVDLEHDNWLEQELLNK